MTTVTAPAPTVRRAEARDAAALAALFADPAMLPFTPLAPFSSASHWERRLADYADACCLPLLAFAGEVLVGVLLLRAFPNHVRRKHQAQLDLLAVCPDHRRRGVGRALLTTALTACDEALQLRRIEVDVPRRPGGRPDRETTPLERFYASFGFVGEGVKRCDVMQWGAYADSAVLARTQRAVLPAPTSPPLPPVKRSRRRAVKFSIRAATEEDAEGFADVFADRSASLGTLQHPYGDAATWRARLAAPPAGNRHALFVAIVNGQVVGHAGAHPLSDNPRQRHVCGVGITIASRYQGVGIGRALMAALLDFADRWANYSRVELTVHADNLRAIQLYESLGFAHEGCHREFSFRDGGYADALFMARLSPALLAARSANTVAR
ncbi:MAG: GNAT family N-acetyltransferase [Burkholderiales bacterium]|nr:GNAT family N-acetyltransferase [Burkholderiales bacterium]